MKIQLKILCILILIFEFYIGIKIYHIKISFLTIEYYLKYNIFKIPYQYLFNVFILLRTYNRFLHLNGQKRLVLYKTIGDPISKNFDRILILKRS